MAFKHEGEDEKLARPKVDHTLTCTTKFGVVVISLQVGYCWLWSLIIFMFHGFCFSHVWIPFTDGGVWGGFPPHICHLGVQGGC
jgi:hypothetical protein